MVAKVSPAEGTSDSGYSQLCVRSAELPFLLIFVWQFMPCLSVKFIWRM